MTIALTNVSLLTLDPGKRVIGDGTLIIRGDRIEAVGTSGELSELAAQADQRIDGRGMVAMPGLVNAHTHSFQSLLRGLAEGCDLIGFLQNVIYPVTQVMTVEETRLGAALSALEAIKSGTTCLIDNHSGDTSFSATNGIAEVYSKSGIRSLVARGIRQPTPRSRSWNVPEHAFSYSFSEEVDITRNLIELWRDKANNRVKICPAPLTLFLISPEDLSEVKTFADEYNVPIHVHIAEARSEVEATLEDYGCREVEHLARVGVLDHRFHVVHGVWLDDNELSLLAKSGGHVVHCPTSNMNLASGVAPVPDMLASGVNVALASDGIGNHNHDMFSVMKTALLLQRVHSLRADVLTAEQVLEMATLGGARLLGLENEIGSLEPGKKADVVLLDLQKPHVVPVYDLPAAIVQGANAGDVDTVIVDGQIIMEGRKMKTLDETAIVSEAWTLGHALVERAGIGSSVGHRIVDRAQ